jgi:hypothetical protein
MQGKRAPTCSDATIACASSDLIVRPSIHPDATCGAALGSSIAGALPLGLACRVLKDGSSTLGVAVGDQAGAGAVGGQGGPPLLKRSARRALLGGERQSESPAACPGCVRRRPCGSESGGGGGADGNVSCSAAARLRARSLGCRPRGASGFRLGAGCCGRADQFRGRTIQSCESGHGGRHRQLECGLPPLAPPRSPPPRGRGLLGRGHHARERAAAPLRQLRGRPLLHQPAAAQHLRRRRRGPCASAYQQGAAHTAGRAGLARAAPAPTSSLSQSMMVSIRCAITCGGSGGGGG